MSPTLLTLPTPAAPSDKAHLATDPETRGVNIRGVPLAVWQRARQNALASNLPFKQYVIRLLAESQPFPPCLSHTQEELTPDEADNQPGIE